MLADDFRVCPFCKESIRVKAVKCRFCSEWLLESHTTSIDRSSDTVEAENLDFLSPPPIPVPPAQIENQQPPSVEQIPTVSPTSNSTNDVNQVDFASKPANYFIRHWRGDLSLGISYWVNGMLGILFVLLTSKLLVEYQNQIGLNWVAVFSLIISLLALLITAWQAVGVWRSAGKHVSRGGSSIWGTVARIAVGLGMLNTFGVIINNYIPQSVEMLRILAGDEKLPAYKITVLPGGTEVEFRGGLRAGSAKELEKIFSAVPQAKVLHIESSGGRIHEAMIMSKLVRTRQMTTYTSEKCLSAATLVLMSGSERVIATDAKIGFHAGKLPGSTSDQIHEMNETIRTTMQAAGVSASFINRALSTPYEQMWYPTFEEMRSAGVITSQSAGERFATSWQLSDKDWKTSVERLSSYPGFRTIKQAEPAAFNSMMSNYVAALRSGQSEGEAIAFISETTGDIILKYLPAASDEAVLAMRDNWIDILVKYKDRNSEACIAALTKVKLNYSRIFPDWGSTNQLLIVEKVISSGADKVPVPIDEKTAESDIESVLELITAKYNDAVEVLSKPSEWSGNSQRACDILLLYYQEIAKLQDKRSANLIRYLLISE